jgi:hypothetical protein
MGREEDLMGYMVYSANDPKHKFVPVSKQFVSDSIFADSITLKTLTKTIYYKVVAFDKNRNPSVYSDPLELKKPLKVAPVPPVFTKFFITDSTATLHWIAGNSRDVIYQKLYRRENGKDWEFYAKLGKSDRSFTDHNVKKANWYEYCMEEFDSTGLHSVKSFPMNVRVYDSGKRPEIQNFKITTSKDGKSLVLTWNYPGEGSYWFVVYKSINGKDFITFRDLPADQRTFTDLNLIKATYQYSIKAFFKDGGESPSKISEKVEFIPGVE